MKKFIKIFVLLMFAACFFAGCKGEVENGTPEEVDEPDDLTLLDKVQRLFSDEDIAGLTQKISNPSDYIFPTATYKFQFLITSEHNDVQVIQSCSFRMMLVSNEDGVAGGTLGWKDNHTVLLASSKSAKQQYNPDYINSEYFPPYYHYNEDWHGWKGLIGYYYDSNLANLWGYTVIDIVPKITQNASSMQTNSANDKFYIHKTVNGTDIQICMIKED